MFQGFREAADTYQVELKSGRVKAPAASSASADAVLDTPTARGLHPSSCSAQPKQLL